MHVISSCCKSYNVMNTRPFHLIWNDVHKWGIWCSWPSYLNIEINKVEITNTAMLWMSPTKEDSSIVVNTRQYETSTGRRPGSFDYRGKPDTCRRLCTSMFTDLTIIMTIITLTDVKYVDLIGASNPTSIVGSSDEH